MISLHYTSHTKAYNTYYAQCDIVEQSTPLHTCFISRGSARDSSCRYRGILAN